MKYKLIKNYPTNILSLGTIVTKDTFNQYVIDDIQLFREGDIESYPEFWEKIEGNNFEIISFRRIKPKYVNVSEFRFILDKDSIYHAENNHNIRFSLDYMLHQGSCVDSGDFIIESIKRLSDNEVFTIGDKVKHSYLSQDNSTITKIYIIEKIYSLNSDGIRFYVGNGLNLGLRQLEKILELIFITEDGVELFEGDDFWHVDSYFGIARGTIGNSFIKLKGYHEFSTKEKAQEYVDLYKPQYSMKSILNSAENFWNSSDLILLDLNKLKSKK